MLLTTHENLKKNKPHHPKQENGRKNNNNNNRNQSRGNGRNRNQNKNRGANKRRRVSHEIVCATCGITTRVPFQPIPGKPVFCPDCYKSARAEKQSERASKPPRDTSSPSETMEVQESNPEVSE
jgi:CxxC-x17-CxxC domain-containing protein